MHISGAVRGDRPKPVAAVSLARGSAARVLLAVCLATAGCELTGSPQIVCSDMDEATCREMATRLIEEARREAPDKRVVSLTIHGPAGTYDMRFSDGTGKAVVGH